MCNRRTNIPADDGEEEVLAAGEKAAAEEHNDDEADPPPPHANTGRPQRGPSQPAAGSSKGGNGGALPCLMHVADSHSTDAHSDCRCSQAAFMILHFSSLFFGSKMTV